MELFGLLRKADNLGRVSVPAEYRKMFSLETFSTVTITLEKDGIIISRCADPAQAGGRKMDRFGRITIPAECRKLLLAARNDGVEFIGCPKGVLVRPVHFTGGKPYSDTIQKRDAVHEDYRNQA